MKYRPLPLTSGDMNGGVPAISVPRPSEESLVRLKAFHLTLEFGVGSLARSKRQHTQAPLKHGDLLWSAYSG